MIIKHKFRDTRTLPAGVLTNYYNYIEGQVLDRQNKKNDFEDFQSDFDSMVNEDDFINTMLKGDNDRFDIEDELILQQKVQCSSDFEAQEQYDNYKTDMLNEGLFSYPGADMKALKKDLANHKGNVWIPILSLKEEDAIELGLDKESIWKEKARDIIPVFCAALGVPDSNMNYVVGFHEKPESKQKNAGKQPHIHMILWEKEPILEKGAISKEKFDAMKTNILDIFYHDYDHNQVSNMMKMITDTGAFSEYFSNETRRDKANKQLLRVRRKHTTRVEDTPSQPSSPSSLTNEVNEQELSLNTADEITPSTVIPVQGEVIGNPSNELIPEAKPSEVEVVVNNIPIPSSNPSPDELAFVPESSSESLSDSQVTEEVSPVYSTDIQPEETYSESLPEQETILLDDNNTVPYQVEAEETLGTNDDYLDINTETEINDFIEEMVNNSSDVTITELSEAAETPDITTDITPDEELINEGKIWLDEMKRIRELEKELTEDKIKAEEINPDEVATFKDINHENNDLSPDNGVSIAAETIVNYPDDLLNSYATDVIASEYNPDELSKETPLEVTLLDDEDMPSFDTSVKVETYSPASLKYTNEEQIDDSLYATLTDAIHPSEIFHEFTQEEVDEENLMEAFGEALMNEDNLIDIEPNYEKILTSEENKNDKKKKKKRWFGFNWDNSQEDIPTTSLDEASEKWENEAFIVETRNNKILDADSIHVAVVEPIGVGAISNKPLAPPGINTGGNEDESYDEVELIVDGGGFNEEPNRNIVEADLEELCLDCGKVGELITNIQSFKGIRNEQELFLISDALVTIQFKTSMGQTLTQKEEQVLDNLGITKGNIIGSIDEKLKQSISIRENLAFAASKITEKLARCINEINVLDFEDKPKFEKELSNELFNSFANNRKLVISDNIQVNALEIIRNSHFNEDASRSEIKQALINMSTIALQQKAPENEVFVALKQINQKSGVSLDFNDLSNILNESNKRFKDKEFILPNDKRVENSLQNLGYNEGDIARVTVDNTEFYLSLSQACSSTFLDTKMIDSLDLSTEYAKSMDEWIRYCIAILKQREEKFDLVEDIHTHPDEIEEEFERLAGFIEEREV